MSGCDAASSLSSLKVLRSSLCIRGQERQRDFEREKGLNGLRTISVGFFGWQTAHIRSLILGTFLHRKVIDWPFDYSVSGIFLLLTRQRIEFSTQRQLQEMTGTFRKRESEIAKPYDAKISD